MRDLLGLDQPLERVRGQDHLLEHLVLGEAVDSCLVGELALDQRRPHEAGAQRGGADPVLGALERERLDQPEHAVLGRHVADLERRRDERMHGRDREEAPVAARGQRLPAVAGEQERARQQQREQRVPAVRVELGDRSDMLEARVGDDRVEPAERRQRVLDGLPGARARGQVRREGLARAFRVGLEVDGEHPRAGLDERSGDRAPDAARSPVTRLVTHPDPTCPGAHTSSPEPAEREGFEPSDEVDPRHTISSRARSAARHLSWRAGG